MYCIVLYRIVLKLCDAVFDFIFSEAAHLKYGVVMMMGVKDKTTEFRALKFLLIFFFCMSFLVYTSGYWLFAYIV